MYLIANLKLLEEEGDPDILQEADVEEVPLTTCEDIHGKTIGKDVICFTGEYIRGTCHVSGTYCCFCH